MFPCLPECRFNRRFSGVGGASFLLTVAGTATEFHRFPYSPQPLAGVGTITGVLVER